MFFEYEIYLMEILVILFFLSFLIAIIFMKDKKEVLSEKAINKLNPTQKALAIKYLCDPRKTEPLTFGKLWNLEYIYQQNLEEATDLIRQKEKIERQRRVIDCNKA